MCLAIPVRVVEKREGDLGVVDLGGVRKEISLALVDGVEVGDYVILHVGHALTKLDPEEAERTLALFAELGELMEAAEEAQGSPPTAHDPISPDAADPARHGGAT